MIQAVHLKPQAVPPWLVSSLVLAHNEADRTIRVGCATEVDAKEIPALVSERMSVVLVKVPGTKLAGMAILLCGAIKVDPKRERTLGSDVCALRQRSDGDDTSSPNIDRQLRKRWRDHDVFVGEEVPFAILALDGRLALVSFPGPVVVPDPGWQMNFVGCDLIRRRVGGDLKVGPEQKLGGGVKVDGVTVRAALGNSRNSGRTIGRPVREASSASG